MKTGSELDRCSVSQLRTLLSLAASPGESPSSLPAVAGNTAELTRLLSEFLAGESESGQALLDTVSASDSPVKVLGRLKDVGKRVAEKASNESQRNAGRLLYHAAIAAGYAHHCVNLSSRPIASRLLLYEDLAAVLATEPLGAVFRRALEQAARAE